MKNKILKKFVTLGVLGIMFLLQTTPVRANGDIGVYAVKQCPPHTPVVISRQYQGSQAVESFHIYGKETIKDGDGYIIEVPLYCRTLAVYQKYRVEYSCSGCDTYRYVENEMVRIGGESHSQCGR